MPLPLVRFRAQAMQEAVPVGTGAMAAILGLDAADGASRAAPRRAQFGANRRGGRGRQLQRSDADRDRRQQGRRRQGLRAAQGDGRQARAAAAGVGAVPFEPDEAGRRAAARAAGRDAVRRAAHPGGQQHRRRRSRPTRTAIRDALYGRPSARCAGSRCVQAIQARGITHIVECGPGKVLAGMVKRIDADAGVGAVYDPASLAEAKGLLA